MCMRVALARRNLAMFFSIFVLQKAEVPN